MCSDPANTVDFSVIVPTFNRPRPLTACLEALANLDYGRDRFEVIVVDDGSTTPLEPAVVAFADRLDLSLIRQANAGPAAARNRGAQAARGTWLAFTDDDCQPARDWLTRLAREFAGHPDAVVGGHTVNALTDNLCSSMSQVIVDVVYRYYNACAEDARFLASNNLAMARELFTRMGGFAPAFTTAEDRELCDRLGVAGIRMRQSAACTVEHRHELSLGTFCRQHFQYGRGAFHFHQSQLRRGSPHTWSKTGFHFALGNWLCHPFSRFSRSRWPGVLGLLVLWQLANAAGFAAEAARHCRASTP